MPDWEKRQKYLAFSEEDVRSLTVIQSAYNSPYSTMAKRLFSERYGVHIEEITYEISPVEIGLLAEDGKTPTLTPEQQRIYDDEALKFTGKDVSNAEILERALENPEFPLTRLQQEKLREGIKALHADARDKIGRADFVAIAGNASDVPPEFYGEPQGEKTIVKRNPLYERSTIDHDIIMPEISARDLPAWGMCYGGQIMSVTGFGNEDCKGVKLIQDIPDHQKDTGVEHPLLHREANYAGLTRQGAMDFATGPYLDALDGKTENPFMNAARAVHPILIAPESILGTLTREAFPNIAMGADGMYSVTEFHSHHQCVDANSVPEGKGLTITARSPDGYVEALEAGRNNEGKKIGTFMLHTQVHPEVGLGRPTEIFKDAQQNPALGAGGLVKTIAEALIFTALFLNKWQEAGYTRESAPTYTELTKLEQRFLTLGEAEQQKYTKGETAPIIEFVAESLQLQPSFHQAGAEQAAHRNRIQKS